MLTTSSINTNNDFANCSFPIKAYFSHPEKIGSTHKSYNIISKNKILLKSIENTNISTEDDSSESTGNISTEDDSSNSIDDSLQSDIPPYMTHFHTKKHLQLNPTKFPNACICGHFIEHRDLVYEKRKRVNTKLSGITIRPTIPPIKLYFRK